MDVKFRKLFLRYYQQINIKNISKSFLNYLFSWNFLINTRIFKLCMYYTVQTMVCTRSRKGLAKELSFSHKFWFSNWYTFATWWCWPFIFQTIIIWSKIVHSLKYLRSPTLKCKDIGIRKSEFVTKTQFLFVKIRELFCFALDVHKENMFKINLGDWREAPSDARKKGAKRLEFLVL